MLSVLRLSDVTQAATAGRARPPVTDAPGHERAGPDSTHPSRRTWQTSVVQETWGETWYGWRRSGGVVRYVTGTVTNLRKEQKVKK